MNGIRLENRLNKNITFRAKGDASIKLANGFVKSQENLKVTRFIQDVTTNWVPKVVFSRSLPDLAEMSFLEFTESALFYFAPSLLGNFFKKVFSKFTPKNLRKAVDLNITKSAEQVLAENKSETTKRTLATKAAIVMACTVIPAGEYALSFAKNLFTLKVFKKSDFNNIANLNKEQTENAEQQERVKKSAYKHIKHAGILSATALGGSVLLAKYGHQSEVLQQASSLLLQPGAHIAKAFKTVGLHSDKVEKFLKKYITPDFNSEKGKLTLSKGQLLVSTISGFFGYSEAGKDRGKLDQLEVLTRVPFVVFYTVFGSSIFDNIFKKILVKKNLFPDLIKKDGKGLSSVPKRFAIKKLAVKLAIENKTSKRVEFNKLIKQKAFIVGVPYAFALVFVGFFLAGINRFWTKYRYNHQQKIDNKLKQNFNSFIQPKKSEVFSGFNR